MHYRITSHHYHHQTHKCPHAKSKNSAHFRMLAPRRVDFTHSNGENQFVKIPDIKTEDNNANDIPPQITSHQYHHQTHKCPHAKSKNSAHFRMLAPRRVDFTHSNGKNRNVQKSKSKPEDRNANGTSPRTPIHLPTIIPQRPHTRHPPPALARTLFLAFLSAPASSSSRAQSA